MKTLGILGLWFASSVLDKQSTDLTILRPNIKTWFADAFDGRDAEFGRLELAWLPVDDRFVVTIEDAEIRDQNGELLEKFEQKWIYYGWFGTAGNGWPNWTRLQNRRSSAL